MNIKGRKFESLRLMIDFNDLLIQKCIINCNHDQKQCSFWDNISGCCSKTNLGFESNLWVPLQYVEHFIFIGGIWKQE